LRLAETRFSLDAWVDGALRPIYANARLPTHGARMKRASDLHAARWPRCSVVTPSAEADSRIDFLGEIRSSTFVSVPPTSVSSEPGMTAAPVASIPLWDMSAAKISGTVALLVTKARPVPPSTRRSHFGYSAPALHTDSAKT
jgi:hypothetical protein